MPEIPPGYERGYSEVYDPETGERKSREFYYKPSVPTGYRPPAGFADSVRQAYQSMPLKDAERAVSAAIQYQGLRGYQQDLASGMPASEALIRNAPSMFYQRPQAIAPTMRAAAPPQEYKWNPAANGAPAYFGGPGLKPYVPPSSSMPPSLEAPKPSVQMLDVNGQKVPFVTMPGSTRFERIDKQDAMENAYKRMEYTDLLSRRREAQKNAMSLDLTPEQRASASNDVVRIEQALKNTRQPAVQTVPQASATAQGIAPQATTKPASIKAGEVYKGYTFKGGDPSKKENWEKIQ